jgi:hypothetical protein
VTYRHFRRQIHISSDSSCSTTVRSASVCSTTNRRQLVAGPFLDCFVIGQSLGILVNGPQEATPAPSRSHRPPPPIRSGNQKNHVQLQEEKNRRHNIHRLKQCFKFSGGEGKGTNLDEIAWLIANLKETITQQSRVIEELKASQQELKAG